MQLGKTFLAPILIVYYSGFSLLYFRISSKIVASFAAPNAIYVNKVKLRVKTNQDKYVAIETSRRALSMLITHVILREANPMILYSRLTCYCYLSLISLKILPSTTCDKE